MSLELKIISDHAGLVGDDAVRLFSEDGGSIGRSLENDWILPDPDRYISARHAVIDYRGGIYYLVDLSTNGVYVNDEHEPIGKGNPRRLFNGDRLRMGDFEILVRLDKGESLVMPLDDDDDFPEDVEMQVPEDSLRTGVQLLDEEEITGGDEFQSTLFSTTRLESSAPPEPEPAAADVTPAPAPEPAKSTPEPTPAAPKPKVRVQSTPVARSGDDLFEAFLDAAGVDRSDLHPTVDPKEVMQNAGATLREFVDGVTRLLASRANLKAAFSLDQTSILPRRNNPLKLSENTLGSMKQLLVGREGEYLGPKNSVKEVCRDLLFHQDAFLDAMSDAFGEFADRFDPDELKSSFDENHKPLPLLGFANKMRYWDLYCDLYPVITEKGSGRFPSMFAEEFVKSYDRQISDFKRIVPLGSPGPVPVLKPIADDNAVKTVEDRKVDIFDEDDDSDDFEGLDDGPTADLGGR